MRILIAHEALAGAGGVETYLEAVIPALARRGHQVAFLHYNPAGDAGPTRLDFAGCERFGVADLGRTRAFDGVRAWRPDVCFSHNMRHLDIDASLAAEWPVVKMMHGYFGTCVSGQKCHTFPSPAPCGREFGAACLAAYVPRRCGTIRPWALVDQFGWAKRQNALFDRYAALIVASGHMSAEYRRNGAPADRVVTAPLFAPGKTDAPRPRPAEPSVLFLGRMTNLKGPMLLVRAIAQASRRIGSSIRLVMGGEGPQKVALTRLARSLNVDAVFPGWVTGVARTRLFREATIVAVPSVWPEPFGLVGLEAAVHGVPALAYDVGGISEWLRDGVSGRLVGAPGDVHALAEAMATMLADSAALASFERGASQVASEMTLDGHLAIAERVLLSAAARPAIYA